MSVSASELKPVLGGESDSDEDGGPQPNLQGEYTNIAMLLLLYTLQGIPMGFAAILPLLMKERGISYSVIGVFSLTHWPFSLKLLWAPIVDSVYMDSVGRRKTWLIPTQLLIGAVLIWISFVFDLWVGSTGNAEAEKTEIFIYSLTAVFTLLYFLCATQDIAVDGWALTILRPENVGYQSMCNAAGQTFGYAFAYIGALSFQHMNLLPFRDFMFYCGIGFILVTLAVAVLKSEKPVAADEKCESVSEVYAQLIAMWKLQSIRSLVCVLLLWKIPYVGCEVVTTLKMQEKGIPKEHIAFLGAVCTVLSVFVPVLVSKYTSGPRPLDVNAKLFLPRVFLCFVALLLVYFCPNVAGIIKANPEEANFGGEHFPYAYYACVALASVIGVVVSTSMFVGQMGFYARVSPKDIGGTYMTLLNTFANMGGMWVTPVMFQLVDLLTITEENEECEGGVDCKPSVVADGFFLMTIGCGILGLLFYPLLRRELALLTSYPKEAWRIDFQASSKSSKKGSK